MINALSIDVEEYFHPEEVQHSIGLKAGKSFSSRVEDETRRVMELLDRHSVTATFFILGCVAEKHPRVVRMIAQAGHEIGCHSYAHQLVYRLTPKQLKEDTQRAMTAIEDACGIIPRLYRAPSYSITSRCLWALEILAECGFVYDSSIYPIKHDRYGITGFKRDAHWIKTPSGPIYEIPIATVKLGQGSVLPSGGGGYLRLLPYRYTAAGIRQINRSEQKPACIYFHPWEIDPDQPRLAAGLISKWRTYRGLHSMERKLDRLMTEFRFSSIGEVYPLENVRSPEVLVAEYELSR